MTPMRVSVPIDVRRLLQGRCRGHEVDAFDRQVRRGERDARRAHRLDREEADVPRILVEPGEHVARLLVRHERDACVERAGELPRQIRRDAAGTAVSSRRASTGLPKLIAARSTPAGASSFFAESFIPVILREMSPMLHCGARLHHRTRPFLEFARMNPDRHIYLTTAVLAVVFATAINVLTPRDPFAGTTVHLETAADARTARAAPAAPAGSATNESAQRRASM